MAKISLNNGHSFSKFGRLDSDELVWISDNWQVVSQAMDWQTAEDLHAKIAPCSRLEFLERYLEVATYDLVIG